MALLELQQRAQPFVFLRGLAPLAGFRLRGGELVFQLLVLCGELVVFVDVSINALQPARGRGRGLLERGAQRAVQIRQESGAAAKTPHDDRGNEYHDQHERADADALFL